MQFTGGRMFVSGAMLSGLLLALGVATQPVVGAENHRVQIVDNDGSFNPGDPLTGEWGYAPMHLAVPQGDSITFFSPAENKRTHTVTSIEWSSRNMEAVLSKAGMFNSSPTQDTLIRAGGEWTLDTASLEPNHYLYYCIFHPWMVGTFTVTPPAGM